MKGNIMKRFIAIMLAACCFLFVTLCGCESREDREKEQFKPLAQALIEGGVTICQDIYLGGGLEADVPADNTEFNTETGTYFPVISDKYDKIDKMKRAAELVFTNDLASSWLYRDAFEGERPLYREQDGVLCVDITNSEAKAYGINWLYDTLTITTLSDVHAQATIDTCVGDEAVRSITVDFVRTNDGWRINSQLFI